MLVIFNEASHQSLHMVRDVRCQYSGIPIQSISQPLALALSLKPRPPKSNKVKFKIKMKKKKQEGNISSSSHEAAVCHRESCSKPLYPYISTFGCSSQSIMGLVRDSSLCYTTDTRPSLELFLDIPLPPCAMKIL